MRLLLIIILLYIINIVELCAQATPYYQVKAGEVVVQIVPIQDQYYYKDFQDGVVYLKNGNFYPSRLNYNILYGEMHFIDTNGDTLALVNEFLLKKITIGEDLYYLAYNIGCVKVISDFPYINLLRQEKLEIIESEVSLIAQSSGNGARGQAGFSISYSTSTSERTYRKLFTNKAPGYLHLAKRASYYFIDKNERFYPARKSTLLKLSGRHKAIIEQYIKENQTDFTAEEDLKKLLEFCSKFTRK